MADHRFDFTFPLPQAILPVVYDRKTYDQEGVLTPSNMNTGKGSSNSVQPLFRFTMLGPPAQSPDSHVNTRSPNVAMKNLMVSDSTPEQQIEQTLPAVVCKRVAPAAPAETPKLSPDSGMELDDAGLATHTDTSNELQLESRLVCVNYDVQDHIMSFLPGSSLTALMMTCRYFSEVALLPLFKMTPLSFHDTPHLLSFRRFLRIGSSTPRWPHIRRLDFRFPWLTSEPLLNRNMHSRTWHRDREHSESFMDVLLHILRACRNLEHLRIPDLDACDERDIEVLCQIVSMLPVLTELHMALPPNLSARTIRKLARPRLLTLTFDDQAEDDVEVPEVIQHLFPLRQSLVELCLPRFRGCILPPDVVFPCVQRLTIGFPGPTPQSLPDVLRQSFPNLLHLRMTGSAAWHSSTSDIERAQLESLREHHRQEWRSKPNVWPALASLSCNRYTSESGLYGLAIPCHVPYLSVRFDADSDDPDSALFASRSAALIADVRPSCLEIRMAILYSTFKTIGSDTRAGTGFSEFSILHAPTSPSPPCRFVLTIEDDLLDTYGEAATDALRRELPQLSLTHLLIRHCGEPPETTLRLAGKRAMASQQKRMAAIDARAYETASTLVGASRSLSWIGIHAYGHTLRSWEILRMPSNGSAADAPQLKTAVVLQELDKHDGQRVMIAEGMVEVESAFVPL